MNNKISMFIGKFIGYSLIIVIPLLFYLIMSSFIKFLGKLEQNNLVTFFSILFSSIIGIIIFIIQKYYEKRKEIDIELIKKKSEIYDQLITAWFDYFQVGKKVTDSQKLIEEQQKLLLLFYDLAEKGLFLWANETTLIYYSNLRQRMANNSYTNNINALYHDFGIFMKLIRKELGHKDKKIKNSDIYGLYINDIYKIANLIN